jgi:hypothetical protein
MLLLPSLLAISQAARTNTPAETLAASRTVYVSSGTVFFKPEQLVNELDKREAFKEFHLSFVNDKDAADLILELDHTLFTYKFSFKLFSRIDSTIIATGNVIITDGNVGAPAMADRVIQKIRAAAGKPEKPPLIDKPAAGTSKPPNVSSEPRPSKKELLKLIRESNSDDLKIADNARDRLGKITSRSESDLIDILKNGKACEAVVAGQLLMELRPGRPELVPTITKVVRSVSIMGLFNLQKEMMCRRGAAYLLDYSAEGLAVLADLLQNGDAWEKETAVFALDDLTETNSYPPNSTAEIKKIIQLLAPMQNSKQPVLRDGSGEILGQISRLAEPELAELAKRTLID